MKSVIPRYNFYKTKYGSELLIDVVDLKYTRKFLTKGSVHILTYYDITFITEGEGNFTISNRTHQATPGDVFFSKPGEVRSWDTDRIGNGYALIFEDTFLTSFSKTHYSCDTFHSSEWERRQTNFICQTDSIHGCYNFCTI